MMRSRCFTLHGTRRKENLPHAAQSLMQVCSTSASTIAVHTGLHTGPAPTRGAQALPACGTVLATSSRATVSCILCREGKGQGPCVVSSDRPAALARRANMAALGGHQRQPPCERAGCARRRGAQSASVEAALCPASGLIHQATPRCLAGTAAGSAARHTSPACTCHTKGLPATPTSAKRCSSPIWLDPSQGANSPSVRAKHPLPG